jgi:hypothetical protein
LTELLMKFCQQCLINRKISYHKLSNNNTWQISVTDLMEHSPWETNSR